MTHSAEHIDTRVPSSNLGRAFYRAVLGEPGHRDSRRRPVVADRDRPAVERVRHFAPSSS